MEGYITWSALADRAPANIAVIADCDGMYQKYLAWAMLPASDEAELVRIGRLVTDSFETSETMQTYPGSNYWSPEDPFALGYYPYNYCEVFQLRDCNSYYLVYTEWGGHAPEKRARAVFREKILI